ncbi:MAG: TonB-dependent receptor [candidate division KSB1 bacterium]|nr:TonB-dependent receptor [candidate division KSB1 bacterium]
MIAKKFIFITFILVIGLSGTALFGQSKGKIAGNLVDSETGMALIYANVRIDGTMMGAASDLEGNYMISAVPPGVYTLIIQYMGYTETKITDVQVIAGDVTKVNASIKPEVLQAEEVVVTAKALRNTESVLLKDRQRAIAVSDAISAEAISKAGSGNAAEAMKQVTGASVVDGKYVYVRGLGDRYTSTQLNGAEIPSNDPYKRAGSVDLIPSNLIDNIVAVKTFTPDKQGNFSGGTVDIRTKDFPEELNIKFSASTSYNTQTTFSDNAIGYEGGARDWLGMDDGTRAIPDGVDDIPSPEWDPALLDQIINQSRAFNPQMAPEKIKPGLNQSYSFSIGNQIQFLNKPLGFLGSLSYSNGSSSYNDGEYNAWSLGSSQQQELGQIFSLNDTKTSKEVLWGGLLKTTYKLNPNNILGLDFIYNVNGESTARQLIGEYDYDKLDAVDDIYESTVLEYKERTLTSLQFHGDHHFARLFGSKLSWKANLANSKQNEPDLRYFTNYMTIDGEERNVGLFTNLPSTRLFRELDQQNQEFSLDYEIPYRQWSGRKGSFKIGGFYSDKERNFTERSYLYNYEGGYKGDPDAYFDPTNIRWDSTSLTLGNTTYYGYDIKLYLKNGEVGANDYNGTETISAAYAMIDLPILSRLRFIGGARFEKTDIDLVSLDERKADGKIETSDVLPSLNLIYQLRPDMNLRASATRTLARPNFRELAPYAAFDFAAGFTHIGNPDLKRTLINNFDLRWEWFSRPGEIYAVSMFYKDFSNPIEEAFIIEAVNREITWINVDQAITMGVEFELRKNLDVVHHTLSNFSLGTNLSFVESEVDIPAKELEIMRLNNPDMPGKRELEGQSPYLVNLNLNYENRANGLSGSVYYNVFGERLSEVNKNGQPFVYEQPVNTVNLNLDWQFMEDMNLKFAVNNLLNEDYKKTQVFKGKEYIFTRFTRGRTFSLGIGYSL